MCTWPGDMLMGGQEPLLQWLLTTFDTALAFGIQNSSFRRLAFRCYAAVWKEEKKTSPAWHPRETPQGRGLLSMSPSPCPREARPDHLGPSPRGSQSLFRWAKPSSQDAGGLESDGLGPCSSNAKTHELPPKCPNWETGGSSRME